MGLLDNFTQWAQSPQSQPAADGLLATGLGILARNRGLNSGLSAIGQGGLDGLQQYQQSKQMQMQQQLQNAQLQQLGFALKKNQLLYNTAASLLGGDQSGAASAPQAAPQTAPGATDAGGVAAGQGGSGPGVQSFPVPSPSASAPTSAPALGGGTGAAPAPVQYTPAAPATSSLFGNIPPRLAGYGLLTDPNKLFEIAAGQYSPTDLQKQMTAAGIQQGSPQWNATLQAAVDKATRIEPTSLRPGAPYIGSDNQIHTTPSAAPAGYENLTPDNGRTWQTVPIAGGLDAIRASTAAQAGGKAQYELQQVWDPTANGGKGGFVQQTTANVADAASGGAPSSLPKPLRNNNPGAVSPGGQVATYPDLQTGVAKLDQNLANYANDPKVKTLGDAITKWVGSPPNAPAYVQDVSTRLGIPPNTPVDLTNPVQRQAIGTAIMLHENGPKAVFGAQQQRGVATQNAAPQTATAQAGGPMLSQPPLGQTANANAAQAAPADAMQNAYLSLQASRETAPALLESLDKMISIAQRKPALAAGPLGSTAPLTWVSPDAAEYDKQRANVITTLGKSLGQNNTDAARSLQGDAIPDYGKPKPAMLDGLMTQRNQIVANQMKSNLLTPSFNAGDSSTYTTLSNGFDQNIKPSMVPILSLSGDAQRAAVQSAIKTNPSLRPNFQWAFSNGLLK